VTGAKVREFVAQKAKDPNPEIAAHFGTADDTGTYEGGLAHSGHPHGKKARTHKYRTVAGKRVINNVQGQLNL
jgi:hypothetical protein